jgi:hypothetical protein
MIAAAASAPTTGFDSTHEGLKRERMVGDHLTDTGFDSTYEGLKP